MSYDWRRLFLQVSRRAPVRVLSEPVEEALWADRLKYFHPTEPGQILDGRFKTIAKLGYGRGSTVWLAENLERKIWSKSKIPRYVCVKITALDLADPDEIEFLQLVSNANPSHEGLKYIRVLLDVFDMKGENGTHSCLVFEPMGETLYQFQRSLPGERFQIRHFKAYLYMLLKALDYLHTDCRLIHTDIKDDNIMVFHMADSDLKPFANYCKTSAQPHYVGKEDGRVTYLSYDKISGKGGREVLLGIPWSYKVDIWNLGLMMWNLVQDTDLFENSIGADGEYDAHVHLAQMASRLGAPPRILIERERLCRQNKQDDLVNLKGKECETMNEYWGGPFFDDEGCMIRKDLIKEGKMLPQLLTDLTEEEKSEILDLAADMIQWLPEKRKTAAELLKHPVFLNVK
ncbi:hypothetical protein E4U25_005921 [Claviceps purpurea]|nr:hypothetical protein E4U25_005921 [Claviceps purpurea]KAG6309239.1 hypothetical protein E4U44_007239 [Claviceps purpurea]